MKLYLWRVQGYGQYSFGVLAESEDAAREAVTRHIREHYQYGPGSAQLDYEAEGWGTDHYLLEVLEPGQIMEIRND